MTGIERLGIVGAGNVGASLVMELASEGNIATEVVVASRSIASAEAAILDAGSAFPEQALKFEAASTLEGTFDVVVVTAGVQPHGEINLAQLLEQNTQIVLDAIQNTRCEILVVLGTPVDRLTQTLCDRSDLSVRQVIGFGGQLDLARLQYALLQSHGKTPEPNSIVGEHGGRAIPVYPGEQDYEEIRKATTSVLARMAMGTVKPRNLATGVQLARLLKALGGDSETLCICVSNDEHDGLALTWPHVVNEKGANERVAVEIGPIASALFDELLKQRRDER